MVALARAGVTATCSRPDGPRYGAIDVDSNLPDVRIALGGPAENPFTAAVLAAAGPASPPRWPAAGPRAAARGLGAGRRGPGAGAFAPGTTCAARATCRCSSWPAATCARRSRAVAARPGRRGDRGARRRRARARGAEELGGLSVALLNRGTPGSLVTPDGTLTISLMRACSSWPCGVWIDGDKRATPDGSSFAWQHWSHTFEYALAAGPGDWRSGRVPLAGQDYNHGLLACETGLHDGPLPATASLAAADAGHRAAVRAEAARQSAVSARPAQPGPPTGWWPGCATSPGAEPASASVRLFTGVPAAQPAPARARQRGGLPLPVRDGAAAAELPPRERDLVLPRTGRWHPPSAPAVRPGRRCRPRPPRARAAGVHPLLAARQGARPRPGTCRWPCTSPPAGPRCCPAPRGPGAAARLRLTVACGTRAGLGHRAA